MECTNSGQTVGGGLGTSRCTSPGLFSIAYSITPNSPNVNGASIHVLFLNGVGLVNTGRGLAIYGQAGCMVLVDSGWFAILCVSFCISNTNFKFILFL